jgi:catechol 2,3-dioxygenase-like lactoylglutathione lyase family enzyme
MPAPRTEHVNVTVRDPDRAAALMQSLFGWRIRWLGPAMAGGRTIHVGSDEAYVALYTPRAGVGDAVAEGRPLLNHIGGEVDDLDATEERVLAAGLATFSHASYDPGRRFYFLDPDGIEYEVVSYR